MALKIEPFAAKEAKIAGLHIIQAKQVTDERGTVRELYRESSYSSVLPADLGAWRQVNLTRTQRGAVRGLHGEAMAKLVTVAQGEAFGVYVDTRLGSPTQGAIETVHLLPGVQVFVPEGVCNGFQAVAENTEYLYFFDNEWQPGMQGVAVTPLDPALAIEWPVALDPENLEQVSAKDAQAPTLKEVLAKVNA